ncbi:MAG TPA: leucyl aminopeptidase [Vicinamibacterales bacterium]|jgi:leucyl aminopeptidase
MALPLLPTTLAASTAALDQLDVDWVAMPLFEGELPAAVAQVDDATRGELGRALTSGEFKGKRYELFVLPVVEGAFRARRLVLVGGGAAAEYRPDVARRLATVVGLRARERRAGRVAFVLRMPDGGVSAPPDTVWIQAVSEGLTLAEHDSAQYKSIQEPQPPIVFSVVVQGSAGSPFAAATSAADRGRQIAHCVNLARELTNEPGNLLSPRIFGHRARHVVSGTALTIDVLDGNSIDELGMGLIAGVGRGSHEAARVIVVRHDPPGARDVPVLGLIGKGVTFDSGGLSLKTADGMERMKDDMAGGAAVLAAMRAIALLQVPVRVVAVVPAVENMPGGGATRPGDVLRGGGGRTVEVVNTDAEGRLLLGDALWYAQQLGATHLVDIATLTGACAVALGRSTAGLFGRPDSWRDRVRGAADRCGERVWPLPLIDEEREQLKSEIADTVNSGTRYGGAITGALFVGEFAVDRPWAHIDIAGPAWNSDAKPYQPKGATGYGVRTLVDLALDLASNPPA